VRFDRRQVVVSCEHASNRVPASLRQLGLTKRQLDEHIAWDRGAAIMARAIASRLGAPLHLGRWSRLVVDLNRNPGHPKLVASESFGRVIPANRDLDDAAIMYRLQRWWKPYRDRAGADVTRAIAHHGRCLQLSIHSFTPVVDGVVRRADIGLLYDPRHAGERDLARRLRAALAPSGLGVFMNQPYRGTSDGFTTSLRARLPHARYAALEIEANQRLLRSPDAARRMGRLLAAALDTVIA
jgi:predicted N-formylglutamate amidohydrolase